LQQGSYYYHSNCLCNESKSLVVASRDSRQAAGRQELGQQVHEHIAAHGIANHHAQLPVGDALAVLEVRQWQALEAEAFSQRHAAAT
jgi:hypothetical protein